MQTSDGNLSCSQGAYHFLPDESVENILKNIFHENWTHAISIAEKPHSSW